MRRAVRSRVLPEEARRMRRRTLQTMLEFARREVRWCQGNMQYLKCSICRGRSMMPFQLVWAIGRSSHP